MRMRLGSVPGYQSVADEEPFASAAVPTSHQVKARRRRAAVAKGLRKFAADTGGLVGRGQLRCCGFAGEGSPDLLDAERFHRQVGEQNFLYLLLDKCVLTASWLRNLCFACLRFRQGRHGDVDVFEDAARSDAENTFGRLDEIVSLAAAVLTTEGIDEGESVVELFGLNEEASAVGLPFDSFHGAPRVRFVF